MSRQLLRVLFDLEGKRRHEAARCGLAECPVWVFHTDRGRPLDESVVRLMLKTILKAAALPIHFSPRCLRHSFACHLLRDGVSPAYVQRQLGHASIQVTVDT